jgi:5-methyltetrahydropteroyltriglutamate--homocysteine methyltransferase
MAVGVALLGFPRIGAQRELKFALERHWSGELTDSDLLDAARSLRSSAWAAQAVRGATVLPSNDFSLYDHVLDMSALVGALPERFERVGDGLATYFAAARGVPGTGSAPGLPPSKMTKWFDTNYHYLVPELHGGQRFALASSKVVDEFREAAALGYASRPVFVGPVTYLLLSKTTDHSDPLALLPELVDAYVDVLRELASAGAAWVQLDEPVLVTDLPPNAGAAFVLAYSAIAASVPSIRVMLATYFGGLGDNVDLAASLPVAGVHVDLVRDPAQLDAVLPVVDRLDVLSVGVVDGRNVWRTDLDAALRLVERAVEARGPGGVQVAPSCSLLHVPVDRDAEEHLDPVVAGSLAFAVQKIDELATIARGVSEGRSAIVDELDEAAAALDRLANADSTRDEQVRDRVAAITPAMTRRNSPFAVRREAQRHAIELPLLPTTTIGSFPQTPEVRRARAAHARGAIDDAAYDQFLATAITDAVRWQDEIGIDVLVHGEFERNDMVQYFAEQLEGYVFTEHGWVQSYGSRCVRPPIIAGDVRRSEPMTVRWTTFAQSMTDKPVKGMLTGPVTMLQWSFMRQDLARDEVSRQIALALRDEVADLEAAGVGLIQLDEPALREGLPLRRADWPAYLTWAVESFRLASSGVADATQIHTHMCYSEFNDIIDSIAALDADVISIETARSNLELLDAFTDFEYPNQIGPGIYDIHAPLIPTVDEMTELLERAAAALHPEQIWVNPDCGLKTRRWEEVRPALERMVAAAAAARASLTVR